MNDAFSVQILGRGEGIEYTDADGIFRFDLGWTRPTVQLHAYQCSDEAFHPRQFTDEQKRRIIPRIVAHLQRGGTQITVLPEVPPQPLRSVDDILQERFRERSGHKAEGP